MLQQKENWSHKIQPLYCLILREGGGYIHHNYCQFVSKFMVVKIFFFFPILLLLSCCKWFIEIQLIFFLILPIKFSCKWNLLCAQYSLMYIRYILCSVKMYLDHLHHRQVHEKCANPINCPKKKKKKRKISVKYLRIHVGVRVRLHEKKI